MKPVRICPNCGGSKAAAVTSPVEPGDYMVCGGCCIVLRLDENTMPVVVPVKELEAIEDTNRELARKLITMIMAVKARKAQLN